MLLLVRIGRWELCLERKGDPEPVPSDTPPPMEVWTPEYVGFLPPQEEQ